MPSIANTYVDKALTNVSVKYTNNQFKADEIFPVLEVDKKTGVYYVYDKSNLRKEDSRRVGSAKTAEAGRNMSKTSYGPLDEHALKTGVTKDEMDNYDSPLSPMVDATEHVTEKMAIEKEVDLATDLANTAIVTQNTTLSGTSQWSDYANSDPFTNIEAGLTAVRKNGVVEPNTAVMSQTVWDKIKHHPDLLDRVKWSNRGVLTTAIFADLIGVQNVIVCPAVYNTVDEGQTDSLDYIWGKHFWVMHVTPRPGLKTVSGGYHLTLKNGRYVDRWQDEDTKTEWVRANDYYERKIIAVEAMYLIKNAVA